MNDILGIMTVMILGCGLYCLWAWYQMKTIGEINVTLLLGKQYEPYQCKNKKEFVAKSLPAVLILGVFFTLYGVLSLAHMMWFRENPIFFWADKVMMVLSLLSLIRFAYVTSKLRKEYFN